MDTTDIQNTLDHFDSEGGIEKLDDIKDTVSSAFGDLTDLVGALKRVEDALDEADDEDADSLSAQLADVIRALEEAVEHLDKAHDGMTYANTDLIQEIRDL